MGLFDCKKEKWGMKSERVNMKVEIMMKAKFVDSQEKFEMERESMWAQRYR